MQREANTLAHVVLMLLNIWKHLFSVFEEQVNMDYILVSDLAKRWKGVENPLYFLDFALHPYYRVAATGIGEGNQKMAIW